MQMSRGIYRPRVVVALSPHMRHTAMAAAYSASCCGVPQQKRRRFHLGVGGKTVPNFYNFLSCVIVCLLLRVSVVVAQPATADRHVRNVTRLTFECDNGEAYFSWDDRQLIWQARQTDATCDKI